MHPFRATVYKTVRPMLSDLCPFCLSCLSVTLVYSGQTVGWIRIQGATWYGGIGLGPGDIVLDGDRSCPTERATVALPQLFGPLCSGTAAHLSNC